MDENDTGSVDYSSDDIIHRLGAELKEAIEDLSKFKRVMDKGSLKEMSGLSSDIIDEIRKRSERYANDNKDSMTLASCAHVLNGMLIGAFIVEERHAKAMASEIECRVNGSGTRV